MLDKTLQEGANPLNSIAFQFKPIIKLADKMKLFAVMDSVGGMRKTSREAIEDHLKTYQVICLLYKTYI